MSESKRSGYCKRCDEQRVVFRKRANHVLHLLLTVLTLGLWVVIWLGVAIQFGGWRCSVCGGKVSGRVR